MIIPRYYEDLKMLHENTMPVRAYYIPASGRMDSLVENREDSDRIQMLNGKWKFCYYKSVYELEDAFYAPDYDISAYNTINVPGAWQMEGMICTSTPISVIRSHLTRHMSHRTTHAGRMCTHLITTVWQKRPGYS